jgi:rubrerythrin
MCNDISRETSSKKRVLAYLRIAIKLEEEAIRRYDDHITRIENPEVNVLLEGIRRNEERHLRMLNANMKLEFANVSRK